MLRVQILSFVKVLSPFVVKGKKLYGRCTFVDHLLQLHLFTFLVALCLVNHDEILELKV